MQRLEYLWNMGAPKLKNTSDSQDCMMTVAKLLSNSTAIAILKYLHKAGLGMQSSIIRSCNISQPACSKHLKALAQVGLVTKEVFRTTRLYSINRDGFKNWGLSYRIWLAQ